jgi:hypothetical protein
MPLEVNEISSESSGDVSITDPLKVDQIFPRTVDKVLVGGVGIKGDEATRFVNIGANDNGANIVGAVIIGANAGSATIENSGSGIAIGDNNLPNADNLASNIAIGFNCMTTATNTSTNAGARNNVCIGVGVGINLDGNPAVPNSSSNNTLIGRFAGTTLTSGYNNICIGNQAEPVFPNEINSITLGNNQIGSLRCNVQTITSLSDKRDKKDIEQLPVGLDFVNDLKPVIFKWNERAENGKKDIKDFGFIAQDLKKSQEDVGLSDTLKLVLESNPDKLEASYGKLLPIMVKAMQEMSEKIELLEAKVELLEKK